jgi:hypothetical protein
VADRDDSLPGQPPATDPLRAYCPDLDEWPRSWSYETRDIPPGLRMVEYFTPFLRDLLARNLSRKTLRQHRDNIWVLGGEVVRELQMDGALRTRPIAQVVLNLISDDGGPLLSHHQSEAEQRSFDATCRKLFHFLTASQSSHIGGMRPTEDVIDGTNAKLLAMRVVVKPRSRAAGRRRRRA